MAPVKKTATKVAAAKAAKPKAAVKKSTAKKPAAKKPAAKTTVAKKPAVKKSAAKKPAVKKTTAKKPAAKTTAVKKPAAKAAATKKPAAKKAEVKTTVKAGVEKKSAVKKTEVKTAVKTAAKTGVEKKPAAKVSDVKKTTPERKPLIVKKPAAESKAETVDTVIRFRNLFDAFHQQKLPFAHGYIVSSFFNEKNAYSIYEIVSYAGVKEIFPVGSDLTFVAGGKKLHILVENATYQSRHVEPMYREKGESIPKRESELDIIISQSTQTRIMVAKEPVEITGSFTILKPSTSLNFAVVFYQLPDLYQTLAAFFEDSLNRQRKVPRLDAKKAANLIASTIEKTMGFKGEFEQ